MTACRNSRGRRAVQVPGGLAGCFAASWKVAGSRRLVGGEIDELRSAVLPTIAETFAMARSHDEAGRLADAERLYRLVLANEPVNAEVLFLLAGVCHRQNRLDAAVAVLEQGLRLEPDRGSQHHRLGIARAQQGHLEAAIESLQRAAGLGEDTPELAQNLNLLRAGVEAARGDALLRQ